jgi:hypothetical protein
VNGKDRLRRQRQLARAMRAGPRVTHGGRSVRHAARARSPGTRGARRRC